MFKIRPHHFLCMRAYSGNGYSEEFKAKIEEVIKDVKVYNEFLESDNINNQAKEVEITFCTDSLCESCPNMLSENKCSSQEKVDKLDSKMINYFSIKEGIYDYAKLEKQVYDMINEEIFDDICKECEWYNKTNCKEYIINKKCR